MSRDNRIIVLILAITMFITCFVNVLNVNAAESISYTYEDENIEFALGLFECENYNVYYYYPIVDNVAYPNVLINVNEQSSRSQYIYLTYYTDDTEFANGSITSYGQEKVYLTNGTIITVCAGYNWQYTVDEQFNVLENILFSNNSEARKTGLLNRTITYTKTTATNENIKYIGDHNATYLYIDSKDEDLAKNTIQDVYITWYNEKNGECLTHTFNNGVCQACGYKTKICTKHSFENGICQICGYYCLTHEFEQGVCTICGFECAEHEFQDLYHTIESLRCLGEQELREICTKCGMERTRTFPKIDHEFENGICKYCGNDEKTANNLKWYEKLWETIKDILETIKNAFDFNKKFQDGSFIINNAGTLINEKLAENEFYTSIVSVKNTLTDLFNEDYSSRTGFYELGLTNITIGTIDTYKHKDFGNETIGPWEESYLEEKGKIDFGVKDAKVLNLDWYFGEDLGDGYYKKGMKPFIDNFISAFLWLMYAWALYVNMPNWISGEMTRISNLTSGSYGNKETVYTTDIKTVNNKTGETVFEGTTTKTTKKGK